MLSGCIEIDPSYAPSAEETDDGHGEESGDGDGDGDGDDGCAKCLEPGVEPLTCTEDLCRGVVSVVDLEDTYVDSDAPSTNHGQATELLVDGNPPRRALLRARSLPTLPEGSIVDVATLHLSSFDSGAMVQVHRVVETWDGSTVTWDSQPSVDAEPLGGFQADDEVSVDILELMEAWAAGAENHGLQLRSDGGNGSDYHSSEAANENDRPRMELEIHWTP